MRRAPTQIVSRGSDVTRLTDAQRAFAHFRGLLPRSKYGGTALIDWEDLPKEIQEVIGHVVDHIQQSVQIRLNQRKRKKLIRCAACVAPQHVLVCSDGHARCEKCGELIRDL